MAFKKKVVTGLVRFSYLHALQPHAQNEDEKPKYSSSILIPKKDKKTIAKLEAAINEVAEQNKTDLWGGKIPRNFKTPLRDGDEERPDDEAYEGMMFFNCSSTRKPMIVGDDLEEIIDPNEIYSGMWGRVSINFYAFSVRGNNGVAAGLNHIQKLKDDEPLSGPASTAADDFGDEDGDDDLL